MTLRRRGENGSLMILRMQIPPDKYSADLRIKHMSRVLIKSVERAWHTLVCSCE
jgi:hypothetical protein